MWFSLDSLGNGSVLKLCAVQTQHYGSCQSDPTVRNRPLAAKVNFILNYTNEGTFILLHMKVPSNEGTNERTKEEINERMKVF